VTKSRSGTSGNPAADLYEGLSSGGFCTALAGARGPVEAASEELERQREAARRGCAIARAVIMIDRTRRHDPDVEELLARDNAAGVRTFLVDAANELPPGLAHAGEPFGVWDDRIVTYSSGRVSRDPDEVRRASDAAEALRVARADPLELILDEPLARAARLARDIAPDRCLPAVGCGPYHGLVQYLRLLGIVASPQRHGYFYREALVEQARSRSPLRVLIAGAADASMLIHVLEACAAAEVTVIDRCATPLVVCDWYGRDRGVAVRTVQSDVAGFHDGDRYDLICTESLLTLIHPDDRPDVMANWRALLRPGGRIVTTARIAGAPRGGSGDSPAEAFAERVRFEAERRRGLLDVAPAVLSNEARRYHGTVPLHPIASREELVELFTRAGLGIVGLEVVQLEGRGLSGQEAAGHYRSAEYARLVARVP
jgi:SAM-dependent methyltransferase